MKLTRPADSVAPGGWRLPGQRRTLLVTPASTGLRGAAAVLALTWGGSAVIALIYGEAATYATDVRWAAAALAPALCAWHVGRMPRAIDRFWSALSPWLANPPAELESLRTATPAALVRYFWPALALCGAFAAAWIATISFHERYQDLALARWMNVWYAPFFCYYGALAISARLGFRGLVRQWEHTLELRPGFVWSGGKHALSAFNHLLWENWYFLLAIVAILMLTATPAAHPGLRLEDLAIWAWVGVSFGVLLSTQGAMSAVLRRGRQREHARLQERLEELSTSAEPADPTRGLHELREALTLMHRIRDVEQFSPSIMDMRFAVQISLSTAAILIGNVLLRTVLAGFLPA